MNEISAGYSNSSVNRRQEVNYLDSNSQWKTASIEFSKVPLVSGKVKEFVNARLQAVTHPGLPLICYPDCIQEEVTKCDARIEKLRNAIAGYYMQRDVAISLTTIIALPIMLVMAGLAAFATPFAAWGMLVGILPIIVAGVYFYLCASARNSQEKEMLAKSNYIQKYNQYNASQVEKSVKFYRGMLCKKMIDGFDNQIASIRAAFQPSSEFYLSDGMVESEEEYDKLLEAASELKKVVEFYQFGEEVSTDDAPVAAQAKVVNFPQGNMKLASAPMAASLVYAQAGINGGY